MHPSGLIKCDELRAGDVGYIAASIKSIQDTRVGDTVTTVSKPASEPLPGYKKVNPMVYCGIYPADGAQYEDLKEALSKLQLNDAALLFEPEDLSCARIWIPLRILGSAPYGNYSGAP